MRRWTIAILTSIKNMSYFDNFDFSLSNDFKYITEEQVNASYYGEYDTCYESDNRELLGEIALWRAVLLQAFIDAKSKSKKKRNQTIIQDAKNWFLNNNQDDVMDVCDMANCSYNLIKNTAKDLLQATNR